MFTIDVFRLLVLITLNFSISFSVKVEFKVDNDRYWENVASINTI